jgi:hypothetical protein
VRLFDEAAVLACAAYVDLNPIRAAPAETLGTSDFSSIQRRIESLSEEGTQPAEICSDRFLAPVEIEQRPDAVGPAASVAPFRASDKGFLSISVWEYIELLRTTLGDNTLCRLVRPSGPVWHERRPSTGDVQSRVLTKALFSGGRQNRIPLDALLAHRKVGCPQ